MLETSKLACEVERIIHEFKTTDQSSESSILLKKYLSLREQYIDEICKEIKIIKLQIAGELIGARYAILIFI